MSDAAIRASELSFAYTAGAPVLHNLTFSVNHGERLGIVGANGAGKSTLLLLLAGVMPPLGGQLTVCGIDSRGDSLAAIRRHVGLIFQNPDDMLFMPTVGADVAFGPEHQGLRRAEVDERVRRALTATGAAGLSGRPPWGLSGGEKRAVSIAAVLSMEPSILLLDEPSAGLDPASRRDLMGLIPTIPGTVIVASHDLDLVIDVCTRVIVIGGGRVAADGLAADILRDGKLLAANRLELPLRLQACPRCGSLLRRPDAKNAL
jgi:cobalt/nickel transport system ATP-binding protein